MPLVAHNALPTFNRLRAEGRSVLDPARASTQEIREMHIGLLNMMPDKALEATERQFFRLIGESNQIAQFYVHPFTLPQLKRGKKAQGYIDAYYDDFEDLKRDGLDALIITGANVSKPDFTQEAFWQPLQDVMGWAWENVTSTLCSCLATHAVLQFKYGQSRSAMDRKLWGVYPHRVLDRAHPLTRGMNTVFDVPHSRFNRITRDQFAAAKMTVLAASDGIDDGGGVHMAVSEDGFRLLCFQGHPEYDTISLHKEYMREIGRFAAGELKTKPPYPEHYYNDEALKVLKTGGEDKSFDAILENTWRDSARTVIGNWIGQVYQTTHVDRRKQFMDGINPDDPLGIRG
ncbi:MAG: homoserine O-succinyltransferase MetA [Bdellovibrionales bacterium]